MTDCSMRVGENMHGGEAHTRLSPYLRDFPVFDYIIYTVIICRFADGLEPT